MAQSNPFSLTKANDLSDEQIHQLWVDLSGVDGESLVRLARPSSPMPTFILGGKGSGKTHLMRYCSFAVQQIRYRERAVSLLDGVAEDGYLGIYVRCSGLNSGRFHGKGQSPDAWIEVFSYYTELWLAQSLLRVLSRFFDSQATVEAEFRICQRVDDLFDIDPPNTSDLAGLLANISARQKALDFEVNNAAFTGQLDPGITVTRGKLVFGLPEIVASEVPALGSILFTYQLDEFENLSSIQQQHINTLVREREPPTTFKIGARQFGVKTRLTFCDDEENVKDSEFDELRLDQRFRENEESYKGLALDLVIKRIEATFGSRIGLDSRKLVRWFEENDRRHWSSPYFNEIVGQAPSEERVHMINLRDNLEQGASAGTTKGVETEADIARVVRRVSVQEAPLLEKLNCLLVYSSWARGKNLIPEARSIAENSSRFMQRKLAPHYRGKLGHYRSDLIAQMLRENRHRQVYAGLDTFIKMSEGQPRALITLLKHTYDWAVFEGERPFFGEPVSVSAQSKGAAVAADWFYNSMMKAGSGGRDILLAINRLAELFRINRYSDNPWECSLIGFSANLFDASEPAVEVIRLATDRSFLVEIAGGQSERNSERITTKLQLNRMLVPRWGLPTGRRGIATFDSVTVNAIFDPAQEAAFEALKENLEARCNAPFLRKRQRADAESAEGSVRRQTDLFG